MDWLENYLDRHFKRRDIVDCERHPYLTRWHLIDTPKFAVMVHKFHRSDEDRALHDHPWAFITFILTGGYYEWHEICQEHDGDHADKPCARCAAGNVRGVKRSWRRRWSVLFRPATWRHRVEIKEAPVWTFVMHFKRTREWGFWMPEGFVHWQKWWRNNCE